MSAVVDTSAVLEALLGGQPPLLARMANEDLHAPHLLDTEFLHVLRRVTHSGAISLARAEAALEDFQDLPIQRYPHEPLTPRVWALRGNLTAYDATFVALAEALGVPLLTCDAKLHAAPGNSAVVHLFT